MTAHSREPAGLTFVTHRGSVDAWECDENQHLNVRFYVAKAHEGLPFLLAESGWPPSSLQAMGARPRVLGQHLRFLREARVAAPLTVYAGIAAARERQLTLYEEVRHSLTQEVMATLVTELALVGPGGEPRVLAPSAAAPRCGIPPHGAPRGVPAAEPVLRPDRAAVAGLGFVEIGRGTVAASECDGYGELELFRYIGRVADSVVNLMTHFQTPDELARRSHGVEGGALIELRIAYHAPLRAGSPFTVHSGIRAVARKVQRFVHLVYEEPAGACAASFDAVAVAMDLRARKAVELPVARRRRMEARLIRLPG